MTRSYEAEQMGSKARGAGDLHSAAASFLSELIRQFCMREDLATYDPYDIWSDPPGLQVKNFYNAHPKLGLAPAGVLALADSLLNTQMRRFYRRREYAVVRALAALSLLNLHQVYRDSELLRYAEIHLNWLIRQSCAGFAGNCWGLSFPHAVSRNLIYKAETPFSTITPYPLEVFAAFDRIYPTRYRHILSGILNFFDREIVTMEEDDEVLATSYGPLRDRTVVNAISYTMFAYAALLPHAGHDRARMMRRISKLYAYLRRHQRPDGSWLYSPEGRPFIDCFHSCIVIKNIVKTNRLLPMPDASNVVEAGYAFIKKAFLSEDVFLFRRFALRNKPGLVRFDLYDNSEVLQLAVLLDDMPFARKLVTSIIHHFCLGNEVYSEIDFLGVKRRRNTLRWAVMPFLFAASSLLLAQETEK